MPFAELNDAGTRILVHRTEYRERELMKQVPGARYEDGVWQTRLGWPACHALRGIFGDRLSLGPNLNAWAADELEEWVNETRRLLPLLDTDGDAREYGYQRVGSAYLRLARYGILGDDPGTGKTVQAAVALAGLTLNGPVLIVCPNSVKRVWESHLAEWAPGLRVAVAGNVAAKRTRALNALLAGEADVLVLNWEALRLVSRLAPFGSVAFKRCIDHGGDGSVSAKSCQVHDRPLNDVAFDVVIADEAHRAKEPTNQQTGALWWVSRHARYRWALTGTPIANTPDELWPLLHFINPDEWPSRVQFISRYCLQEVDWYGHMKIVGLHPLTESELRKSLDVRMLRRTKEMVLPQLPPKTYETRYFTLSAAERKRYDQMKKDLVAELDELGDEQLIAWNPLSQLTRLIQFASAAAEIEERGVDANGKAFVKIKLIEPSSKLNGLFETIEDLGPQPLVIAAESRQLIEMAEQRFAAKGIGYVSVHGNIEEEQRAANVEAFQNGKVDYMLLTVGAGGEGITLHRASTIVFLQRSWSMVRNMQCEDRIHRIGQEADNVLVVDLMMNDTVEQQVRDTYHNKLDVLEEVTRDRDKLRALLSGK